MKDLTDKEFYRIRDFIKQNYGISLGDEKKTLVYSRLRPNLQEKGFKTFTDYFDYLINDKSGEAIIKFINKVTTNHTYFMRESDHFDFFKNEVLPNIEKKYASTKDLRIWCAGCSSGEEPYTLQIIAQEYFKNKSGWNTEMLATDISTNVLTKAILGIYPTESIKVMPLEWQKEYFVKLDDDNSQVSDKLRECITFRKLNLMDERFTFKKPLQAIFCRNVMIYFDNTIREKLVKKFYDVLDKDGYLFIGHSESLNQINSDFKYIMPAIYKKV